jgi:hypothetical protein
MFWQQVGVSKFGGIVLVDMSDPLFHGRVCATGLVTKVISINCVSEVLRQVFVIIDYGGCSSKISMSIASGWNANAVVGDQVFDTNLSG